MDNAENSPRVNNSPMRSESSTGLSFVAQTLQDSKPVSKAETPQSSASRPYIPQLPIERPQIMSYASQRSARVSARDADSLATSQRKLESLIALADRVISKGRSMPNITSRLSTKTFIDPKDVLLPSSATVLGLNASKISALKKFESVLSQSVKTQLCSVFPVLNAAAWAPRRRPAVLVIAAFVETRLRDIFHSLQKKLCWRFYKKQFALSIKKGSGMYSVQQGGFVLLAAALRRFFLRKLKPHWTIFMNRLKMMKHKLHFSPKRSSALKAPTDSPVSSPGSGPGSGSPRSVSRRSKQKSLKSRMKAQERKSMLRQSLCDSLSSISQGILVTKFNETNNKRVKRFLRISDGRLIWADSITALDKMTSTISLLSEGTGSSSSSFQTNEPSPKISSESMIDLRTAKGVSYTYSDKWQFGLQDRKEFSLIVHGYKRDLFITCQCLRDFLRLWQSLKHHLTHPNEGQSEAPNKNARTGMYSDRRAIMGQVIKRVLYLYGRKLIQRKRLLSK